MKLWGKIFAALYDRWMAPTEKAGLSLRRAALIARAEGRVLEIGGGTGANLKYYTRNRVAELVISEPEARMAARLERRLDTSCISVRLLPAAAEQLPVESGSFDCVVSTLVLCTVADPARALHEVRRVLKPRGRLLFIEHVRSESPRLAWWQDRLRVPWAWFGCGCQCNRRTVDAIRASGFDVEELRHDEMPKAPPIVKPLVVGIATKAG